jgi:hypothetical protein
MISGRCEGRSKRLGREAVEQRDGPEEFRRVGVRLDRVVAETQEKQHESV